jgi:hypothetical protein
MTLVDLLLVIAVLLALLVLILAVLREIDGVLLYWRQRR